MGNHGVVSIKPLVKHLYLYHDQNETTRNYRWKKTDPSDRIAFREGGVVLILCGKTCLAMGKIQVCVEQSNSSWRENPGDFQLFSIYFEDNP